MRKFIFTLAAILSFCKIGLTQNTIEHELQNVINQKGDEMISINIILKSQMNPIQIRDRANHINDKKTRRNILVDEMKLFSEKEQREIMSILNAERNSDRVSDISSHWLANYINCNATPDVIYKLAEHPDVLIIGYDEEKVLVENNHSERASSNIAITENITKVNADDIWEMGYTGDGIIVAVIDSGVNYKHVDIADHLWDGGPEFPKHGYNTYDGNNDPMDKYGHGTHCAGTICGDGTSGTATGIAPNATLMCVKSVSDQGTGTANNINSGMEWAIEHHADVMSISLGVIMPSPSEKTMLRRSCESSLELGIVAAVAAGNYGDDTFQLLNPVPNNVIIPGGCPPPWLHPDQEDNNPGALSCVVSVGAVDYNDNPADFSSEGPVSWQDTEFNDYPYNPGIGLIRPDICAPGVSILSLDYASNTQHTLMDGTSMATPCVAGIICLMLEKNPELTPAEISMILETTSVKLSENKNNITGSGRVDALAAINKIDNGNFTFISYDIIDHEGNDNANINADENINVNIIFNNNSEDSFENVKAVLRSNNKFVTITDSIAQIDNIPANANIPIINEFAITVDNDTKPNTLLALDIYFYDKNDNLISYLRVPTYASGNELQFSSFIVRNDDNDNGILEAGETADLGIVLNNIGNEIAVALKGSISTTNNNLTINQSESEFGSIGDGASATAFFNVTLSDNAGDSFKLPLEITATDAFGKVYNFSSTYKNSCEIIFELYDTGGDGWNKAALIVKYSDGTPDEAFTVITGNSKTYKRKIANNVEITIEWVKGSWDVENSFVIKNENDNIIYRNGGFLENGFLYSWINDCSCQNNSIEMCEQINNLNANVNKTTVNLSWDAPANSNVTNYEIYRDTKLLGTTENLSFTDESLNKSGKYVYSVRAVYENCYGTFSHVTVDASTNIMENSNIKASIYPNPSHGNFTIICDNMQRVSVYNTIGSLILDTETDSSSFVVSQLKPGIYFIKIETNNGNTVHKIIVK